MPENCKKCFANITAQHLKEINFERKKVMKETQDFLEDLIKNIRIKSQYEIIKIIEDKIKEQGKEEDKR